VAFNKEKILQSAQELISKGKLAEAIREYQRVLSQDPRDQNALNIIGDLYSRMKNPTEAVRYYTKLADVYVKEGFLVRGIAMFKKISKLDTHDTNAMERLADLYTMQGLLSEARSQYLQLAEMYLKGNQAPQALQVMQKVLDLDPENLKILERLATLYERHGQPVEAAKIYRRMAERLLNDDQIAESLQRLEKAVALAPDHPEIRLTQGRALQKAGRAQEALAALEKIANLEEQTDALELLLTLRLETGQPDAAFELAEKIFAADPQRVGGLMQLARYSAKQGDSGRALEVLGRVGDAALHHDPFHTLEALREISEAIPEAPQALELLARAARSRRSTHTDFRPGPPGALPQPPRIGRAPSRSTTRSSHSTRITSSFPMSCGKCAKPWARRWRSASLRARLRRPSSTNWSRRRPWWSSTKRARPTSTPP
jgi:tetratricopeptide (TPR) repeat protein